MTVDTTATVVVSFPRVAWDLYIEYLWNYEPNSWVASAAYMFRILGLLMFAPVITLTLLVSHRSRPLYHPSVPRYSIQNSLFLCDV